MQVQSCRRTREVLLLHGVRLHRVRRRDFWRAILAGRRACRPPQVSHCWGSLAAQNSALLCRDEVVLLPEVEGTGKSFSDHRSIGDGIGEDGWFGDVSSEVSSLNDHSLLSALSEAFQQGLVFFGVVAMPAVWQRERQPSKRLKFTDSVSRSYGRHARHAFRSNIVVWSLL